MYCTNAAKLIVTCPRANSIAEGGNCLASSTKLASDRSKLSIDPRSDQEICDGLHGLGDGSQVH